MGLSNSPTRRQAYTAYVCVCSVCVTNRKLAYVCECVHVGLCVCVCELTWSLIYWVEPLVAREEHSYKATLVSEIIMWLCDGSLFSFLFFSTHPHLLTSECLHLLHSVVTSIIFFFESAYLISTPTQNEQFKSFATIQQLIFSLKVEIKTQNISFAAFSNPMFNLFLFPNIWISMPRLFKKKELWFLKVSGFTLSLLVAKVALTNHSRLWWSAGKQSMQREERWIALTSDDHLALYFKMYLHLYADRCLQRLTKMSSSRLRLLTINNDTYKGGKVLD